MKKASCAIYVVALLLLADFAAPSLKAEKPVIDRISPPNWFSHLPSPMLLVHGFGLAHANFSVSGQGITLQRIQLSPNGHWAFLWLKTDGAQPQTIRITAATDQGTETRGYELKGRTEPAEEHRGFDSRDLIYLVMTDRFADGNPRNDRPASDPGGFDRSKPRGWHGGDFAGIEQHLDYIQSLGATALWTTPVYDNGSMPDSYHGYAATNLYDVDRHFGSIDDYRHLSAALHARGMKLIIDLVPNHVGIQHPWVADPPMPDWFHGTPSHHETLAGPHFDFNRFIYNLTDPHASPAGQLPMTEGWFTDEMPDMNQENPAVSQYLIQNALWWVETAQLDAIRIDTFPFVGRRFWHDFHAALHAAYPKLTTVGEIFYRDPVVTSFFAGGREHAGIDTGLDTPFDFPVYFAVRDVLAHDKPMTELEAILRQDSLYPHPERLVHFFGNHDTSRFFTEAKGSLPRLKQALGLLATLRGTPELYAGDEIAMPGGEDPDNRRDFPGGFPRGDANDVHSAFSAATRTPDQQSAFEWTAALFAFRKSHRALQAGLQQSVYADQTSYIFARTLHPGGCTADNPEVAVLVAVNTSPATRTIIIPTADTALARCKTFQPAPPAGGGKAALASGAVQFTIPADSFALFTMR
jgi:glycosidase